jgi:hypothetical protein
MEPYTAGSGESIRRAALRGAVRQRSLRGRWCRAAAARDDEKPGVSDHAVLRAYAPIVEVPEADQGLHRIDRRKSTVLAQTICQVLQLRGRWHVADEDTARS